MVGEKCFVRRNHIGAGIDGRKNESAGGFDTAHEFNNNVRFTHESLGVGRDEVLGNVSCSRRIGVSNGDSDELESCSNPSGQFVAVPKDLIGNLSANASGSEERDSDVAVFNHGGPLSLRQTSQGYKTR